MKRHGSEFANWGDMPAGLLPTIDSCTNVYDAMLAWSSLGGKSAEWIKRNPGAYKIVTSVIKARREAAA